MPSQACTGDCPQHGRLCELDPGHDGGHECHECHDCPGQQARRRAQTIADRVASHKAMRDLTIAPDED